MPAPRIGVLRLVFRILCLVFHSASSTFEAQSAIRAKQNCHSMGEAAGVAAAWCAARGVGVREIDGVELREALRRQGANL